MKSQRVFYLMGLLLGVVISVTPAWTQSKPETKGPVIRNSYATDKGQYGTIWKIYIEAEAVDADMTKIAVVVDQAGFGHYPTDFILIDPQHRKHLKGYLQWNTFSSKGADLKDGDRIRVNLTTGEIEVMATGVKVHGRPFPPVQLEIYRKGGLLG